MRCKGCKKDKLVREFPPSKLSSSCRHPVTHCMRCVLSHVKERKQCPNCSQTLDLDEAATSRSLQVMEQTLAQLFKIYEVPSEAEFVMQPSALGEIGDVIGTITVTIVTGENIFIEIKENMTVLMLKKEIHALRDYAMTKQSLTHKGREMKNYGSGGDPLALASYGVVPGSNIHLMIRLYAVPDSFDRVIFALSWDYPDSGKDYLDATCLLYNGSTHIEHHDYRQDQRKHELKHLEAVTHYGDMMDDKDKRGVHILTIFLKKLPPEVTHIFFTLSAFMSPNISAFPQKAIHMFDAANPNKALCDTAFVDLIDTQAVIMCYVKREESGKGWHVIRSGQMSHGNATYYKPLLKTISECIEREC